MIVCSGGTAGDVPRSAGSAICSEYRLVLLAAWVLVEEEKVFLVSGFSVKKEMKLPGSGILDEVGRMVLFFGASAGSWCFWDPFSWLELDWAGGHRHLMFEHFWS